MASHLSLLLNLKLDGAEPVSMQAEVVWTQRTSWGCKAGMKLTPSNPRDGMRLERWYQCQTLAAQKVLRAS